MAEAPVTGADVVNELGALDLQLQRHAAFVSAGGELVKPLFAGILRAGDVERAPVAHVLAAV